MGTWRRRMVVLIGLVGSVAAIAALARRARPAAQPERHLNGSSPHRGSAQYWPSVPRAPGASRPTAES